MRAFCYLAGVVALLLATADAGAQFPGEIRGDVVDVLSGRPIPSADVRVAGSSTSAITDAAGAFRIRGLEPGRLTLHVRAAGFNTAERELSVTNGAVTHVRIELIPDVMELDGVVARVDASPGGARVLSGAGLRAVPAASVGELAESLPGVRVESRGRGGSQIPSIRGSGGDAVLVLVDGVPINDPVTGEADLSTIPAASVSAIYVLPGGRSARYGARAEGGVILVETSGEERSAFSLEASAGSLGERSLDGHGDIGLGGGGMLELGAGLRRLDGRFEFEVPEEAGGGRATRDNARVRSEHARLGWEGEAGSITYRLGIAGERLERGLPGRSFAPSRTGEQELDRGRASGSLEWTPDGPWRLGGDVYGVLQRMEHHDPAPPLGDPFDDRTTLRGGGGELRGSWRSDAGVRLGFGVDVRHLAVRSSQLAEDLRSVRRTDTGLWLTVSRPGPLGTALSAAGRLDRSGFPVDTYLSHDIGIAWAGSSGVHARIGHRSSFSPPTLGDQFFREGVGVEPNPALRAERVPSEWTVAVGWERDLDAAVASLGVEAYRGDIQGMIVWLPDFRFVWSPRNRDVRRYGAELAGRLRSAAGGWDLRGHFAWTRATYDRPGLEDTQVVYRPELSGGALLSWSHASWRVSLATDLVGARYPVPNRVNRLPAFWTTDVSVARRWVTGLGTVELGLHVDRVFDHEDSLIFAYPDPGRTARLIVRLGS